MIEPPQQYPTTFLARGCDGFNPRGSFNSSHGQSVLGIDRGFAIEGKAPVEY
jgi:hypothetical protein